MLAPISPTSDINNDIYNVPCRPDFIWPDFPGKAGVTNFFQKLSKFNFILRKAR